MLDQHIGRYKNNLVEIINSLDYEEIHKLAKKIEMAWDSGKQVFICGNGGSAGNAIHIANDFIYGIGKGYRPGMRFHALTANSSILTCLANDEGYDKVFAIQLKAMANKGDILVLLSGSGNSPNIIEAIKVAKEIGVESFSLVGYTGGKCLELSDHCMHFKINDMQISEDMQLIVMHMVAQYFMNRSGSAK